MGPLVRFLGAGVLAVAAAALVTLTAGGPEVAHANVGSALPASYCGWNGSTCANGQPPLWSNADNSSKPYESYAPTSNSQFNPEATTIFAPSGSACASYFYVWIEGDAGGAPTNQWDYIGGAMPGTAGPTWSFAQLGGSIQGHITVWVGFQNPDVSWDPSLWTAQGYKCNYGGTPVWADQYPTGASIMDLYSDSSPPPTPAPTVKSESAAAATFSIPGENDIGNGTGANYYSSGTYVQNACYWSSTSPVGATATSCGSGASTVALDPGSTGTSQAETVPRTPGDYVNFCVESFDWLLNTTGVYGCASSPPPAQSPPTLAASPSAIAPVNTAISLVGALGAGIPSSQWSSWDLAIVPAAGAALPSQCPALPWQSASSGSITAPESSGSPTTTSYVVIEAPVGHLSQCTVGNTVSLQWLAIPPEPNSGPAVSIATGPYPPSPTDPIAITGLPQNFWINAPTYGAVDTQVVYQGQVYTVTYTPTAVTWTFGDGGTASFAGTQVAAGFGSEPSGTATSSVQHTYQTATVTQSIVGSTVTLAENPWTYQAAVTWTVTWRNNSTGSTGSYGTAVTSTAADQVAVQQLQSIYAACGQLTASPASPEAAGTAEALTASSAGCVPSGSEFMFVAFPPGSDTGAIISTGSSANASWTTTGLVPGIYNLEVEVAPAGTTSWSLLAQASFDLTAPTCSNLGLTASPGTSVATGTAVNLTGSATCPTGSTPSYEFTATPSAGSVISISSWSSETNPSWNTSGLSPGSYTVTMSVAPEPGGQGAVAALSVTVTLVAPACTNANLASSSGPSLLYSSGDTLTASASCSVPSLANYEFTYEPPGASYWVVLANGTSPTINWSEPASALGSYGLAVTVTDGATDPGTSNSTTVFVYSDPGLFTPITDTRIVDTRPGSGYQDSSSSGVPPDGTITAQVGGYAGVPTSGVSAVALNVMVITPNYTNTTVTVYDPANPQPQTVSAAGSAGQVSSNLVIVPVSPSGSIALHNNSGGYTHLIVEVEGWFAASPTNTYTNAGRVITVPQALIAQFTASDSPTAVTVLGVGGVPAAGVSGVLLAVNSSAPGATSLGYAYPAGQPGCTCTQLYQNSVASAAGTMFVPVGTNGQIEWVDANQNSSVAVSIVGYVEASAFAGYTNAGSYQTSTPTQAASTGGGYNPASVVGLPAATWNTASNDGTTFYVGTNNYIWYTSYVPGSTWLQPMPTGFGPVVASTSGPSLSAVTQANGVIDLFWESTDGQLWWASENGARGSWNQAYPLLLPNATAPSVSMASAPSAVTTGNNQVDVFYQGSDGQMWWDAFNGNNWTWSGQAPLSVSPSVLGQPVAVSPCAGCANVFWKDGSSGNLWEMWWGGSYWMGPIDLGMGALGSTPTAWSQGGGEINVAWRGSGTPPQPLWQTWTGSAACACSTTNSSGQWPGGPWQGPQDLGGGLLSPPLAVAPASGQAFVVYEATDGNIYDNYWNETYWSGQQEIGMGPLGDEPVPVASGSGGINVFWQGQGSQDLWQAWAPGVTSGWNGPSDLTTQPPASPTQGNALVPGENWGVDVGAAGGIPAAGAEAVVAEVVAQSGAGNTLGAWYASGASAPSANNYVGIGNQETVTGGVVPLGASGQVFNVNEMAAANYVNITVDVSGWFTGQAGP